MGAAIGARLTANGATVLTALEGRSRATRERALAAGMRDVSEPDLLAADLLLSIVPPAAAPAIAERVAALASGKRTRLVFADCNAISPQTLEGIASRLAAAGVELVDAGIIGGPPAPGEPGPRIYASGPAVARIAILEELGLDLRMLDAPLGAASALKMSFAGITKGLTAVAAAMLLAAERAGIAAALAVELADSQTSLLEGLSRSIPRMFGKAYRWVGEMQEIAQFAHEDAAAARLYEGAAALYERIARNGGDASPESQRLREFLERPRTAS